MIATAPLRRAVLPSFDFDQSVTAESVSRHIHRHRRVHVGPAVSLVFEDRHTLAFRMDELARIARREAGPSTRRQIDWYRRLMPGDGRLTAAVWVGLPGCRPVSECASVRRAVVGGRVAFRPGLGEPIEGHLLRERVSDRLIGLVGWIEFHFSDQERAALADPRRAWRLAIDSDDYSDESEPLNPEVRRSLAADLGHAA